MSEVILGIVGSGVVGVLSGAIGAYTITKIALSTDKINKKAIEVLEDMLDNVASNPALQEKVYSIGALLGKGIADGTGLKGATQKAGKFSIQGVIGELLSGFLQNKLSGAVGGAVQQAANSTPGVY